MVTLSVSDRAARPEIPALTGVRFMAAFCILLNHLLLGYVARDIPYVSAFLSSMGSLGMTLFFVLSGFIVHYNYSNTIIGGGFSALRRFFVARIARLYPLYISVVVFDIILVLCLHQIPAVSVWASMPFYITATHGWLYFLFPVGISLALLLPRASITWSISTEFFLYMLYPAVLRALNFGNSRLRSSKYLSMAGVIVTVLCAAYFYGFLKKHTGWFEDFGVATFGPRAASAASGSYSFSWWALFLSPFARFFEFFSGMVIAQAYLQTGGRDFRRLVALLGCLSLLYIVAAAFPEVSWYSPIRRMNAHVGYLPFCVGVVAWMAWGGGFLSKVLGSAPLRFLGDRSYSFYLVHIFVYAFGLHVFTPEWFVFAKIAAIWTILFVVVCISYRYLEVPARRYIRNRFS